MGGWLARPAAAEPQALWGRSCCWLHSVALAAGVVDAFLQQASSGVQLVKAQVSGQPLQQQQQQDSRRPGSAALASGAVVTFSGRRRQASSTASSSSSSGKAGGVARTLLHMLVAGANSLADSVLAPLTAWQQQQLLQQRPSKSGRQAVLSAACSSSGSSFTSSRSGSGAVVAAPAPAAGAAGGRPSAASSAGSGSSDRGMQPRGVALRLVARDEQGSPLMGVCNPVRGGSVCMHTPLCMVVCLRRSECCCRVCARPPVLLSPCAACRPSGRRCTRRGAPLCFR
jgi:hypothetical protein